MNRLIFSILMLFCMCLTSRAQQKDAEGWPIYWLRGDMTGWNCTDQYRFTRQGNKYTLHVSHLDEGVTFKPATSGWEHGYGTYNAQNPATPDFVIMTQYRGDNNNFKVQGESGWDDFDITFEAPQTPGYNDWGDAVYLSMRPCSDPDHGNTGGDIDIDDGNWPEFYLRIGNLVEGNLGQEKYKFTRNGNEYSLYVEGELPGGYDNWFKISTNDQNWSINYGTNDETPTDLPFAIKTVFLGTDNNYKNKGWSNFDIKFKYDRYNYSTNCPIVYFLPHDYQGDLPTPEIPGISGSLPVLYINVKNADGTFNNEVISYELGHKDYFSGEYWLDMNGVEWMPGAGSIGSAEEPLPLEIKARGNYTRQCFAKKPFKLKLGKKQSMLGLTKSKHFAILAHADDDKGFLRNFVGFNLGRRIGLPWTPDQQPVEVVINGDYRGLYFLTESIRVGDDRVMIEELDDNVSDMSLVTGGYIVEMDNYEDTNQFDIQPVYDDTFPHCYVTYDTPEEYSAEQKKFVYDQFKAMNDLMPSASQEYGNNLWSYLDLDDAVRYYLVEEIISHYEAYHGSTYLFRDRGLEEKWHYSPLWDCGHAFEGGTQNYFYDSPQSLGNTWIRSLRKNSKFNDKIRETWKWFMANKYEGLMEDIDTYCSHIVEAATADYKRWQGIKTAYNSYNQFPTSADNRDIESKKIIVKNYLADKIEWLKGQWGDFTNGTFAEPERDMTPAVKLDDNYINAYGVDYKWENIDLDFENRPLKFDHNSNAFAQYSLGELDSPYDAQYVSKSETTVEVVKDPDWAENWMEEYGNASIEVNDNGELYLNAHVPGIYNIKIVVNENHDTKPWTRRAEKSVTASILPHMDDLSISHVDFSQNPVVVDWVNVNQYKLTADYPLPFEFFYTVKYADLAQPATESNDTHRFAPVLRAGADYPYGLENRYEDKINLRHALEADMAVRVNGVVSPVKHVVFDAISTDVEEIDAAEAVVERFYRLDGTETSAPLSKGIYIRVSGGKAGKIVVD